MGLGEYRMANFQNNEFSQYIFLNNITLVYKTGPEMQCIILKIIFNH